MLISQSDSSNSNDNDIVEQRVICLESFKILAIEQGGSLDHISLFDLAPVLLHDLPVSFIVVIQFLELVVLKGLMIFQVLGDFSSSQEPNTLDIVVPFSAVYSEHRKSVFPEGIQIPQESFHQIGSRVSNHSLPFIFIIHRLPKTPTFSIELLPQALCSSQFVRVVGYFSFVVIEVEWRFWQQIQRIHFLLDSNLFLLIVLFLLLFLLLVFTWLLRFSFHRCLLFLGLGGFLFGLFFRLLLFSCEDRWERFLTVQDCSHDTLKGRDGCDLLEPPEDMGRCFSCLFIIKDSVYVIDVGGQSDICNGNRVPNQIGFILQVGIHVLEPFFQLLHDAVMNWLCQLTPSTNRSQKLDRQRIKLCQNLLQPGFNLSLFKGTLPIQGIGSSSNIPQNSKGLKDVSFRCLQKRGLPQRMFSKVFFTLEIIVINVLFDQLDPSDLSSNDGLSRSAVGGGGVKNQ